MNRRTPSTALVLIFTASTLLLAGCGKQSATDVTNWGAIEVSASNPIHLKLDGADCIFTATPLPDGKAAIVIETEPAGGKDSPGKSLTRQKMNSIVPTGIECFTFVGTRSVRFKLNFKS